MAFSKKKFLQNAYLPSSISRAKSTQNSSHAILKPISPTHPTQPGPKVLYTVH
jgi:hypothetical protein